MANVSSPGRLPGDHRHRADEIHVHRASWWQAFGPLLGLLALLALVALGAWAYMRGRTAAPPRPEISEPQLRTVPPQELPAMPPPPQIEPPSTEPPAAAVGPMDKPSMEEPEVAAPKAPKAAPAEKGATGAVIEEQEEVIIAEDDKGDVAVAVEEQEEVLADPCSATTVYFPTDATLFKDEGISSLNNVADCLKANPTRVVLLQGSADPRGDVAHNSELAKGRAQAVADQLWALGVPSAQVSISTIPSQCTEADTACWQKDRSVKAILSQ